MSNRIVLFGTTEPYVMPSEFVLETVDRFVSALRNAQYTHDMLHDDEEAKKEVAHTNKQGDDNANYKRIVRHYQC